MQSVSNEVRERTRAPEKVPLIPRRDVLQEISRARLSTVSKGVSIRQKFIGTCPTSSRTLIERLQKSEQYNEFSLIATHIF